MKRKYLKKIFKILSEVDDMWILEQIYKFSVGMTAREQEEAWKKSFYGLAGKTGNL